LSERRAQEVKNKMRKTKEQTEYTPQQVYDRDIFEVAICAFYIQSRWRDAFERQREYTRRDFFIGKLNPEKISQRLQDMNKYLDYILIEITIGADSIQNAYGKSFPDEKIRSIMGRSIPPERTVNLLALGKQPWRFKDLDNQMNMYHLHW
jgi:hypothetical protein